MSEYQEYGHSRPRSRTVLSFGSARSVGSGGTPKFTKEELFETPKEKAAKRISTKANPNVAMNESEPGMGTLSCLDINAIANTFYSGSSSYATYDGLKSERNAA